MRRDVLTRALLGLAAMAASAGAQGRPAGTTYMGVFWYDRAHPTTSLQHRLYDTRKGEFDRTAVDRWQAMLRDRYPDYATYAREIPTEGLPGATEPERVAAAIDREKKRWEQVNRDSATTSVLRFYVPPISPAPRRPAGGRIDFGSPPGGSGGPLSPPPSPFPYPYRPRPL